MKSFFLAKKEIANQDVIFTTDLFCDNENITKFLKSKESNKILIDINKKTIDEVLVELNNKKLIVRCSKN